MLFFHGGGHILGHIDLFDGPVSRDVSASGVSFLSVANHHNDISARTDCAWRPSTASSSHSWTASITLRGAADPARSLTATELTAGTS